MKMFPDKFEAQFYDDGKGVVTVFVDDKQIGHPLSDNNYIDDGYRYHDVLHFANAVILEWSPVTRWLLNIQRNHDPIIRKKEDGKAAIKLEEQIAALMFELYTTSDIKPLCINDLYMSIVLYQVRNLEVNKCTAFDWKKAFFTGIKLINKLHKNRGGTIVADCKNKNIFYYK